MSWTGWFRARWVLGWALVKHVLYLPFAGRKGDPGIWLERIGKEALGPTPPGNWQAAAQSARCIGCGLCDALDVRPAAPEGKVASAAVPPMSQIIQGAARLPSDAPDALAFIPRLLHNADAILAICPTGVDARTVAQLIARNAEVLHPKAGLLTAPKASR
jgi:hypothetical protein